MGSQERRNMWNSEVQWPNMADIIGGPYGWLKPFPNILMGLWYPYYPPIWKHDKEGGRERERGQAVMYDFPSFSHHLTGATLTHIHTLKDFCHAKTNGDSLNPRLLRPEVAINNTGPLQVTEPWPTVTHWHPDKAERQGAACCEIKKWGLPKQQPS